MTAPRPDVAAPGPLGGIASGAGIGTTSETGTGPASDTGSVTEPPGSVTEPPGSAERDIAEVPAVEVVSTAALHLMSAAAVHLGLASDLPEHRDLDEARTLIDALAGLLAAGAPHLGHHHAAPLRDGLRSLQLAFREASSVPDEPGQGPGEKWTGLVRPVTAPSG